MSYKFAVSGARLVVSAGDGSASRIVVLSAAFHTSEPRLSLIRLLDEATFIVRALNGNDSDTVADTLARYITFVAACKQTPRVDLLVDGVRASSSSSSSASAFEFGRDVNAWGTVDVIAEVDAFGLYRLNISPAHVIPLHYHAVMSESEMILTENVTCNGAEARYGDTHRWCRRRHTYSNTSAQDDAHILCIDQPKFMRADEIIIPTQSNGADDAEHMTVTRWTNAQWADFEFPGAFPNQRVRLCTDAECFTASDAVLVVAVRSAQQVLTVRHVTRGWEFPGGKRLRDESDIACAERECHEESGYRIQDAVVAAQYTAVAGESVHVKTIVLARVPLTHTAAAPTADDTTESRFEDAEALQSRVRAR